MHQEKIKPRLLLLLLSIYLFYICITLLNSTSHRPSTHNFVDPQILLKKLDPTGVNIPEFTHRDCEKHR
jgi:hypothetical protein